LFIPGPVDVRPEILEAMATPVIGHRTKAASELQRRLHDNMQKVFHTKNRILFSTSSGTGLMEGSIRGCTSKRVAVFSVGAFGDRWAKLAEANGKAVDLFKAELFGEAIMPDLVDKVLSTGKYDVLTITHNETSSGVMNPCADIAQVMKKYPDVLWLMDSVSSMAGIKIPVDEWGVDVCITSSQKCLGLPAGLSMASVSQRAYDKAKTVENRGYYLDLVSLWNTIDKRDYQYHTTPSLSHYFALDKQLDYILNVEGLENRYKRHAELAKITRDWAEANFAIPIKPEHRSVTLTVIKNTKNISVSTLNKHLETKGFVISNGYGNMKEKTFRIAHTADCQESTLRELLGHIDNYLKTL
jgi:predicted phosphoserine aminotransferase